ncbi:hypothetical protein DMENIID0001_121990 [Sergentomyia squamirostris]
MKSYYLVPVLVLIFASSTLSSNVVNYYKDAMDLPCENDDDCLHMVYNKFTLCVMKQCLCYAQNGQEDLCDVKIVGASNFIGTKCPCPIKYSICDQASELCICADNFTQSLNRKKCIPKVVPLEGKCEDNSQCLSFEANSQCDLEQKICLCQTNFTQVDDTCRQGAVMGARCRVDAECLEKARNTVCLDHKCICQRGYIARKNQTECLGVAGYGEMCFETAQCQQTLGYGAVCDSGICVCDGAHQNVTVHGNHTICEKRILVGDTCREHGQCYKSYLPEQTMLCIGGHCQCSEEYINENGQCVKNSADFPKIFSPLIVVICMIVHKIIN